MEEEPGSAGFTCVWAVRAKVYDIAIVHVTSTWYKAILDRLDEGSVVLDVGIGTASK